MNDIIADLQSSRNLFSKAQHVSFDFFTIAKRKIPYIVLHFNADEYRQMKLVTRYILDTLGSERLKVTLSENDGDYLSLSFLWESTAIILSCSPEYHNKKKLREFRLNVVYGEMIKLFLSADGQPINTGTQKSVSNNNMDAIDIIYNGYLL